MIYQLKLNLTAQSMNTSLPNTDQIKCKRQVNIDQTVDIVAVIYWLVCAYIFAHSNGNLYTHRDTLASLVSLRRLEALKKIATKICIRQKQSSPQMV